MAEDFLSRKYRVQDEKSLIRGRHFLWKYLPGEFSSEQPKILRLIFFGEYLETPYFFPYKYDTPYFTKKIRTPNESYLRHSEVAAGVLEKYIRTSNVWICIFQKNFGQTLKLI